MKKADRALEDLDDAMSDLTWVQVANDTFYAPAPALGFYEIRIAADSFAVDAMWRESHTTPPVAVFAGTSLHAAKVACASDLVVRQRKADWARYMAQYDPPRCPLP